MRRPAMAPCLSRWDHIWRLATTPALLIGIDVMSQFLAVELDFGRRQVIFYPRALGG
jgi:hypothetical protein